MMKNEYPTDQDTKRNANRAIFASAIGSMIEWYDFYIYGLMAATIFGKLFFPQANSYSATLLALSTFFVGFAISTGGGGDLWSLWRPLGAQGNAGGDPTVDGRKYGPHRARADI